jgi:hypothetical protein
MAALWQAATVHMRILEASGEFQKGLGIAKVTSKAKRDSDSTSTLQAQK